MYWSNVGRGIPFPGAPIKRFAAIPLYKSPVFWISVFRKIYHSLLIILKLLEITCSILVITYHDTMSRMLNATMQIDPTIEFPYPS